MAANACDLCMTMHIIIIWNLLLLVIQAQDSNLLNKYIIFSVYIFDFLFLQIQVLLTKSLLHQICYHYNT